MDSRRVFALAILAAALGPAAATVLPSPPCPADFVAVGGSCFLFANTVNLDWSDAEAYCQNKGSHLAILSDCNLLSSVVDYILDTDLTKEVGYWIGGNDIYSEGTWMWIDGSEMALGAPFWSRNNVPRGSVMEPNGGGSEDCASMRSEDNFYFHDVDCKDSSGLWPLCQMRSYNGVCQSPYIHIGGSCFQYVPLEENWSNARTLCQVAGGDLAVFSDCNLMVEVISYAQANNFIPPNGYWIGGSDAAKEGTWTWVDGSPMKMGAPFWGMAALVNLNPDNYGGRQNCARLWATGGYYFDDGTCAANVSSPPLCQTSLISSCCAHCPKYS